MMPGISATAHFGGGFFGAAAGFLANYHRFGSVVQRRLSLLGLVLLPVLSFAALVADLGIDARWVGMVWPVERKAFQNEAADSAWSAGHDALLAFQKILPLLVDYRPERRDPQEVKKAQAALTEIIPELEQAANRLTRTGPYRTAAVEAARQKGIDYLQAVIELCRMAQACLKGGENWKQQEKVLIGQVKQVARLRAEWVEALRKAGLEVTSQVRN